MDKGTVPAVLRRVSRIVDSVSLKNIKTIFLEKLVFAINDKRYTIN